LNKAISVYQSGNILARSIDWNACSWRRRRKYSIRCAKVSRPTRQRGLHARYQRELSGPQGDQWWIDVNGGKYKMGKGKISDPNVTFVASDKDWVAVSNGKLGSIWAYLTGRLKIRGDQGLERKLGEILP
jgi:SCP-2 sterol transfer family